DWDVRPSCIKPLQDARDSSPHQRSCASWANKSIGEASDTTACMNKTDPVKRLRGIAAKLVASVTALLMLSGAECQAAEAVSPIPCSDFLDSIGTLSAISVRGETLQDTIDCSKYLGIRWLRAGIEGNVPIEHFIQLHTLAGLRFSWGLGSGGTNLAKL